NRAFNPFVLDCALRLDIAEIGYAAGCNDGDVDALCQAHRCLNVDPAEHAVTTDVCIDDGFHTVVFKLAGKVDNVVAGEFAPAIRGHFAIPGVQTDDDVAGEGTAGIAQKARILDSGSADDDVGNTVIEVVFDGVQVADAAADLNRYVAGNGIHYGLDGSRILGLASDGAVQIHQMQATCALIKPLLSNGGGVLRKNGCVVEVALA